MKSDTHSYGKTLILTALLVSAFVTSRTFYNLASGPDKIPALTWFFYLIFSFFIPIIQCLISYALPHGLQYVFWCAGVRLSKIDAIIFVALLIPATAALTWFFYDYLLPVMEPLGIDAPADWEPYRHGLTLERYEWALAFQIPATAFAILYWLTTMGGGRMLLFKLFFAAAAFAGFATGALEL